MMMPCTFSSEMSPNASKSVFCCWCTNHRKHSGLKRWKCVFSQFCRSEVSALLSQGRNQRVGSLGSCLEALNSFRLLAEFRSFWGVDWGVCSFQTVSWEPVLAPQVYLHSLSCCLPHLHTSNVTPLGTLCFEFPGLSLLLHLCATPGRERSLMGLCSWLGPRE